MCSSFIYEHSYARQLIVGQMKLYRVEAALQHGCFSGIKSTIDTDDRMQVSSLDLATTINRNNMGNIELL